MSTTGHGAAGSSPLLSVPRGEVSAVEIALRALRRHPDRLAFSTPHGDLTYAATDDLIGRLQRVLVERGVRRGDRVALLSSNRAEFWAASTALQGLGGVTSFLHPLASLDDQLLQIADLDAAWCIVDMAAFSDRAGELAEKADGVNFLGIGASAIAPDLLDESVKVGAARASDAAAPDDITMVSYTGGTTGRAKGVARTQRSVSYQLVHATLADFEIESGASYLATSPITHVAGAKVIPVLARGGTIHLQNGFDPGRVLQTIEHERITMTLMVPTMIYALLDHPDLDRADLSSLQLLLYGASPMSRTRLEEGLERIGPVFSQLYGQTECYPISLLHRADHGDPTLIGSCGFPTSSAQTAILDEDAREVAVGEIGEISVRGPVVMDHYWRRPELTEVAFAGGWLRTGDLARRDDRGYLTIVDRSKDLIISGGFNVYPAEVENALTSHPAVSAAAVFGVEHARWGEAVTAVVVLRPGVTVSETDLIEHVRAKKGSLQTPKVLRVADDLPVTALGKVDKRRLRAMWSTGELLTEQSPGLHLS